MKIGLVTITRGENYGNRLQNYAMQTALTQMGHSVETITRKNYWLRGKTRWKLAMKKYLRIKYSRNARRTESFRKFNNRYLNISRSVIKSDTVDKKISKKYDAFICGSDQIWNPNFETNSDSFFLSFVEGKKKIAVAASFGIDRIEKEEDRVRIHHLLEDLDAVSVREDSARTIVEELSSKKAEVVIDPTLMLTAAQWQEIEKKPDALGDKKYVLCYLLGEYDKSIPEDIRQYAIDNGMNIVFLENDWNRLKVTADWEFTANPSEFVWLIRNSEKVITDSFHAVAFSLIFGKKFLVVPRTGQGGDMSSRFANLAKIFGIDNYVAQGKDYEKNAELDYSQIPAILKKERDKFTDFVHKALTQ